MPKREKITYHGTYVVFNRPVWQGGAANSAKLAFLPERGAIRPIYSNGVAAWIRLDKTRQYLAGWSPI